MVKNYFLIAWRNLLKNKLYSLINIGGLAVGMAVSFLLLMYVYNEFTFNGMHSKADRIYKVFKNQLTEGEIYTSGITPAPLAALMQKDLPQIEKVVRTNNAYDMLIGYHNNNIKLATLAADPSIADVFSFDFLKGNQSALSDATSIVLTEAGAKALFGNADPLGKTISLGDKKLPLKVSAIVKDQYANSSIQFKALIPWDTYAALQPWVKTAGMGNFSFNTYALLKPGTSVENFNKKLDYILKRYDPSNKEITMFLYPLKSIHLYSEFKNGVPVGGSIEHIRLFFYLAIGILLIACINFMNLSTARSEKRAREVGVRKAIGARRSSVITQFLVESTLMALFALSVSVVLMILILPVFNGIIGKTLNLPFSNIWAWLVVMCVTIVTGLVAGSYPALFLSSFKPIKVLKGHSTSADTTIRPRQVLVVTQFTFAICLILSSIFIYKQINYIKNRPLGYNNKGVLEMEAEGEMLTRFEEFRRDAIIAGAIVDGAITSGSITNKTGDSWGIKWPGQRPGEEKLPVDIIVVTYHFISTYGLELVAGRDYDASYGADSAGLILNEAAVKMMRLKHPLGTPINWQGQNRTVVGVVRNFVWESPYEPVKPAAIVFFKGWTGGIGLKLDPGKPVSASLATLSALYKKYNPQYPFEYKFTDERFESKFKSEKLLGTMATCFTALAIIISCLGLFALASFSAEQRRKEISIRKVLGAKTVQLWLKLSQEFVMLVLISFAIGAAISWYNIDKWLSQYTIRTSISIWEFVATMMVSVVLCVLTVSWQAIKAAWQNPVKSLRSE